MTNTLYDLGYNDLKKADEILQIATALNAVVADIRFMPHTRNKEFSRKYLQEILGEKYVHIMELGNMNYKGEGEIKLTNASEGLKIIKAMLEKKSVILMCACWKRSECHRVHVTDEYKRRFEIETTPITRSMAREIISSVSPQSPQMNLFSV